MKKGKDTSDLEEYLEAHAETLVDTNEDNEDLIRHAKEDDKSRKSRAAALQSLRKDKLKLSQSQLAKAVGANVRTLQSWEQGRQDYPKSVEILMTLMKKLPVVKSLLLPSSFDKRSRINLKPRQRKSTISTRIKPIRSTKKAV